MLPKQVVSYKQLKEEGLSHEEITRLNASLKLFPTPFKGIYYVPSGEERQGWFIDHPIRVLTFALKLFLSGNKFYYSCKTAEEAIGISWRPSGEVHVVNEKISAKIDLNKRSERNLKKKTFRAKKVGRILSYYGNKLILHKVNSIAGAKTKQTPQGIFATASQIKKDKKRFRES